MSRYDWTQAPEWAQWAATDESVRAYWYNVPPVPSDDPPFQWVFCREHSLSGEYQKAFPEWQHTFTRSPDWHETLEPRPPSEPPSEEPLAASPTGEGSQLATGAGEVGAHPNASSAADALRERVRALAEEVVYAYDESGEFKTAANLARALLREPGEGE